VTEEEKKNTKSATIAFWGITPIYYASGFLWLILPFFVSAVVIPQSLGWLLHSGHEAEVRYIKLLYTWLINIGYLFGVVNIGFVLWHCWRRGFKSNLFKNRLFIYWVTIANSALILGMIVINEWRPMLSMDGVRLN
jgi:hypothetical protein